MRSNTENKREKWADEGKRGSSAERVIFSQVQCLRLSLSLSLSDTHLFSLGMTELDQHVLLHQPQSQTISTVIPQMSCVQIYLNNKRRENYIHKAYDKCFSLHSVKWVKCCPSLSHTHWRMLGFHVLWGRSIGIKVFILYKLYFLPPYP